MRNVEYDKTMELVRDLIVALDATRDTLEKCQAENERLVKTLRYYGNRQNWVSRDVHMDGGAMARDTIKKINGGCHAETRLS